MKKVMVACEESQAVAMAFRSIGVEAYSFDIQECSGGHPEWHVMGDVSQFVNGNCTIVTCDGVSHQISGKWDMIIAFPPCTYMTNAGACRMFPKRGCVNPERYQKAMEAKDFFMMFYNADCEKICIENPRPMHIVGLPKESQRIQPYQFGHPYSKLTYLWLKGLDNLVGTDLVTDGIVPWVNGGSRSADGTRRHCNGATHTAKMRSKTFPNIAKAMASTWA